MLNFIAGKLKSSLAAGDSSRISFVLGTEAGMITSIVRKVQEILRESAGEVEVEIIFPVASEAFAQDETLGVVPGVSGGEGCSTAGGCATCPYMKMNSLDALFNVIGHVSAGKLSTLEPYEPKKYSEKIGGRTAADLGGEPILFMRHFQKYGVMPQELVDQVLS